jgi:hypothetical protein
MVELAGIVRLIFLRLELSLAEGVDAPIVRQVQFTRSMRHRRCGFWILQAKADRARGRRSA